ncbi:cobalamin biosynthesis protein [Marinobacter sp. 1Y8]
MAGNAVIVAGFGYRAAAEAGSLRGALDAACAQIDSGLQPAAITALAAPADKILLVSELGQALGLPVIAVEARQLKAMPTQTLSEKSLQARGTGSVAEAAALAGAGNNASLLCLRTVSQDRMATCALAKGTHS